MQRQDLARQGDRAGRDGQTASSGAPGRRILFGRFVVTGVVNVDLIQILRQGSALRLGLEAQGQHRHHQS